MKPLLLLAALAAATAAQAHYLWATLDPAAKTVAIALQEIPGDEPVPLAERAAKVRGVPGLRAEGPWLKGPAAGDAVGVGLDYGVLDRTAAGRGKFWLRYYAKAATPEASSKRIGLPVELSAAKGADGRMVVTVWHEGKPSAGADVIVEGPVGKNTFEGKTAEDGTVTLPPTPGPLAVRARVTEAKKGEGYDLIRSYSTLTLSAAPKTFSRILHDSFGENHDVVSHSGFIETVMAGKLTRAQLADHLRERVYVHETLDAILGASPAVPYGPEQKNVLTLLRENIRGLGATEAKPWPLTQAFVDEIKASAAKGPYFALGVFHVYYGGITNGGRDIGAMIAEQTRFTPTYYLKSDGYRDYVAKLNATVNDPEARAEAIRGGQAAYRYIIAVNNDPAFKAK